MHLKGSLEKRLASLSAEYLNQFMTKFDSVTKVARDSKLGQMNKQRVEMRGRMNIT